MSLALNEYILDDIINITSNKVDTKNLVLQQYISTENMLPDRKGICLAASMPSGKVNQFLKNDTLFSNIRTYFRKVWFASFDGGSSPDVLIFRTKDVEVLDPRFLYYLISDQKFIDYSDKTSKGAKMPRGDKSAILNYKTYLPTLSVQKRISKILSDLDDKIYLNNQTNQTLESIAQAIFKSWFIDFEPVRAKIAAKQNGEDPEIAAMCVISGKSEEDLKKMAEEDFAELQATAALFPDELVESELGEVPKGWDKYSLSKMITLIGGGTPKRSEPNYWNGDIFWFSVKDVPNEGEVFVITTQEKISELGLNKSSTKLLPVGTTIITARGTVGKIALVGYEMAMNQSCYGVQGINGVRQFMTYYLIKNAVEVLKKNTHGAVFDTITQSTFDTVTSIKPSIEMMDLFESKVEKIMGHIKNNLYENNSLIALRDTLLPKLLSGELDVSGVQDEVA